MKRDDSKYAQHGRFAFARANNSHTAYEAKRPEAADLPILGSQNSQYARSTPASSPSSRSSSLSSSDGTKGPCPSWRPTDPRADEGDGSEARDRIEREVLVEDSRTKPFEPSHSPSLRRLRFEDRSPESQSKFFRLPRRTSLTMERNFADLCHLVFEQTLNQSGYESAILKARCYPSGRTSAHQDMSTGGLPFSFNSSTSTLNCEGLSDRDREAIRKLEIPDVRICRMGSTWELQPSALRFWNTLSLEPLYGPKKIRSWCIFPSAQTSADAVTKFLDQVETAYLKDKLGSFVKGVVEDDDHGVIPVGKSPSMSEEEQLAMIYDSCKDFGAHLGGQLASLDRSCILIYILNPFDGCDHIPHLCVAFLSLVEAAARSSNADPDSIRSRLIFSIVPKSFVAPNDSLTFLEPATVTRLAHEAYNSIPSPSHSFQMTDLAIAIQADVELAEIAEPGINFHLRTHVSPSILKDPSIMHVAYCRSTDDLWLTAAWTDDTGKYQHKAAYCMQGRKFEEIAREILETTLEIIAPRRVSWDIYLACAGSLSSSEVGIWGSIYQDCGEKPTRDQSSVWVFSMDTEPGLQVRPEPQSNEAASPYAQATSALSPASAPSTAASPFASAHTPSKDPGSAPLPPADADSSARLTSIMDESWLFACPDSLNIGDESTENDRALASGYLMKRSGPDDLDPPVLIQVNLLYVLRRSDDTLVDVMTKDTEQPSEDVCKLRLAEVMKMYRDLAILANIRGVQNETRTSPWHIAVVEKGAEALSTLLGRIE